MGGTLACSLLTYVGAMRKALDCISKKQHVPVLKLQKKRGVLSVQGELNILGENGTYM